MGEQRLKVTDRNHQHGGGGLRETQDKCAKGLLTTAGKRKENRAATSKGQRHKNRFRML